MEPWRDAGCTWIAHDARKPPPHRAADPYFCSQLDERTVSSAFPCPHASSAPSHVGVGRALLQPLVLTLLQPLVSESAARQRVSLRNSAWLHAVVNQPAHLAQLPLPVLQIMRQQCTDAAEAGDAARASTGAPAPNGVTSGAPDDDDDAVDALVRRALGSADAHVCLGLHPVFSQAFDMCRKRYLQLAKKLHPDKTTHPQGAEAFCAVEAAWRVLQARLAPQRH